MRFFFFIQKDIFKKVSTVIALREGEAFVVGRRRKIAFFVVVCFLFMPFLIRFAFSSYAKLVIFFKTKKLNEIGHFY